MTFKRFMTGTAAAALAAGMTGGGAAAQSAVLVTSEADSGPGSLRAALADLSETGGTILLDGVGDIEIAGTLSYDGTAPLAIIGDGQTVSTDANTTLFAATAGADLYISGLDFEGPGGFDIESRGDLEGPAGKGIFVDVRDDQTGLVRLELEDVSVSDVANHGIHVSDCSLADDCGGGGGGAGDGSAASIEVRLTGVTVDSAGTGKFDADGVRVDERAAGSIHFFASGSLFTGVGADGVELDEGQDGAVRVRVAGSAFNENGDYCDPERLAGFIPDEPEGAFAEGEVAEDAIPGPVTGTPDDSCIEREVETHDDGSVAEYEFGIDVDDGFDVDEAGAGSIVAVLVDGEISENFDEGLDFDEEGPGGIDLTLIGTEAEGNTDDAYKNSEEGPGGVTGTMFDVSAEENGGVGVVFEEEDAGDVAVFGRDVRTEDNDGGETGLEVVQEDAGDGALTLVDSEIEDGIVAEGVTVNE